MRAAWSAGCLVQANNRLFDTSNRQVLPANVIYSPDPYFDDKVSALQVTAHKLFELKGTSPPDKELRTFARSITDEFCEANAPSRCHGRCARIERFTSPRSSSIRRGLPAGHLATGVFPLLICPEKTDAVMILPSAYWPDGLHEAWGDEAE